MRCEQGGQAVQQAAQQAACGAGGSDKAEKVVSASSVVLLRI